MIDDPVDALIAEHVRRLMSAMGMDDVHLTCDSTETSVLRITITATDSGKVLIGAQGANLNALQHIIRCVLRKHLEESVHIIVDVNGYRHRREKNLFGFAEEVARRAQKTGKPVTLSPMNAIDRRIIHTALSGHKEVQTESMGDGRERRVVVRPVFL
jgi:spoIIIJ-associated protein